LGIDIGGNHYAPQVISEASCDTFTPQRRLLDQLKIPTLAIKPPWQEVDRPINLCLELALLIMDRWTVNSDEIVTLSIEHPEKTQAELGKMIEISQGRVSERQQRAGYEEIMKMDAYFRELLGQQIKA